MITSPRRLGVVLLLLTALVASACGGSTEGPSFAVEDGDTATTRSPFEVTLPEQERDIEPLTGHDLTDQALLEAPAFALKIDNSSSGRPQIGLNEADVVFEIKVENNLSRFMAVFHSQIPAEAGPVRSARSSDVDVASSLGNPVLSYSGSNPGVAGELGRAADAGLVVPYPIDTPSRTEAAYRAGDRSAPYNLIALPPGALATAPRPPGAPTPIFAYRDPAEVGEPGPGGGVALATSPTQPVLYLWGGGLDGWGRWQDDTRHLDAAGVQVAPTNVVVLEVDYQASPSDAESPMAVSVGTGPALVLRNGEVIEGTWTRTQADSPFALTRADGEPLLLDPGPTWLNLAPAGAYSALTPDEALVRALALIDAGGA